MRFLRLPLAILLSASTLSVAAQEALPADSAAPAQALSVVQAAQTPVAPGQAAQAPAVPVEPGPALALQPYIVPQVSYVSPKRELARLDARLDEIRFALPRLAGPIALTAVGGGTAIASAYFAMLILVITAPTDYDEDEPDTELDGRVRSLGMVSLAGLAMSLGGVVWLKKRLGERRKYKPELDALKSRRRQLLQEVRYGANADGQQYALSVTAAF